AGRVRESLLQAFWSEEHGHLADVVADDGTADFSLRPNQLFALGLPHVLLPRDRALRVLDAVKRHLLTPVGLRTLSPEHPAYRGRYAGGPAERDSAYHQGTVWPYLIGPFITAYVKVNGGREPARAQSGEWLKPLHDHLSDGGLGHISEIFDGDAPHRPRGCIAQAWSVAEVLRAYVEDVKGLRPNVVK